jgi:uncharacterized protein (DUF2147 family)
MFCRFRGIGVEKLALDLRFIVMRYTNISSPSGASLHVVTALASLVAFGSPAYADPREAGIWYDDTGKGAVKIEICTPTTLCGKIYWLKEPMTPKGEPKIDRYNPEPAMRTRPICGLPVLGNLEQLSGGGFDNGWVYDPKEGKSYSVALDLIGPDKLKVTGYKGMKFLGKSFIWTRAPDDLPSCATSAEAAPGEVNDRVATTRPHSVKKKKKAGHKAADQKNNPDKKSVGATTRQRHPVASN